MLYTSSRLETLADQLADVLARPLSSPLSPELVLVQSQGMARWLKLALAARLGVCANTVFPFPKFFCGELLAANLPAAGDGTEFDRDWLRWAILRRLPEMLPRPEFRPLKNYLADATDIRKRFQLAAQIANLFDQYLVFRPDLILAWDERRQFFADAQKNPHEAWQAELWRALRGEMSGRHFAELWSTSVARFTQPDFALAKAPERISIFGISALPPAQLQLLYALGAKTEVNLFLLQPSKEYWGAIVSARESEKILKAVKKGDAAALELHLETGNRLLSSLGQLGRDFLNLVLETGDWQDRSSFPETEAENLLQHIQADLFHLRDRGQDDCGKITIAPTDDSLRVHSCHGPLREVEVLHDHLLDWFARDPALTPRDVLVMTPDIEAYAPFIQAVFDSPEDEAQRIPFSLADRGTRQANQVVDVFLKLLNLSATRLEATAVLGILETDVVRNQFSLTESDLDSVREWIRQTNIRWGKDAAQRERLGLPGFAENTWQQGLDRLLLGYAMAGRGEKMFGDILPFDEIEGGNAEVLGHFAEFLKRVFNLVTALENRRPMADWEPILQKILGDFIQPDENQAAEAQLLRATLRDLSRQAADAGCDEPVDLAVIIEALNQSLEADRFGSGFITGGVTFCALKPMRSIPFKVICLIGMNDGAFPRSDRHLSFDLMAQQPRLGDRSLRADDRYLFLETLLSARQRLHLSYTGQSIRDNSEAPPSVLVSELLDYVAQGYELPGGKNLADQIVVQHRLQAFSPKYFNGEDARRFSYSAENCRASDCGRQARVAPGNFFVQPLPEPDAAFRTVDAAALAEFFCHPAKWLLTRRLGLRFADTDEALEETEPFTVGSLDGYAIRQQLVEMTLKGTKLDDALKLMKASGRLPLGEAGAIQFRQLQTDAQNFLEQLRPHLGAGFVAPVPVEVRAGEFTVRGEIRQLTAAGLLHFRCANLKAKDRLRLWIQHVLLNVAFPAGQFGRAVLVGRDETPAFAPLPNAPEILAELLELYWQGLRQPLKFFPQTSLAFAEAKLNGKAKNPLSNARSKWLGNQFTGAVGEGNDDCYDLCFRGVEPLDEEFQQIALAVYEPLLAAQTEVAA
jgi:exodeoxyribonuclease V gamma subunit